MAMFESMGIHRASPLARPRPLPEEEQWLAFDHDRSCAEIYVLAKVVEVMWRWARASALRETIGLLVGRPCQDGQGPFVLVVAAIEAQGADAQRAFVWADLSVMAALRKEVRQTHPIAEVVGWWHSHPGYGTHYSATDCDTQATFTSPNAVGIVVDPTRNDTEGLGVYLGPDAQRLALVDRHSGEVEVASCEFDVAAGDDEIPDVSQHLDLLSELEKQDWLNASWRLW